MADNRTIPNVAVVSGLTSVDPFTVSADFLTRLNRTAGSLGAISRCFSLSNVVIFTPDETFPSASYIAEHVAQEPLVIRYTCPPAGLMLYPWALAQALGNAEFVIIVISPAEAMRIRYLFIELCDLARVRLNPCDRAHILAAEPIVTGSALLRRQDGAIIHAGL
jgi:hypothetical protein